MAMSKGYILAVDDTPTNLAILDAWLTIREYRVRTVRSGAEALAEIERERPDLVLLDVVMPGMDGYQVCQQIKASPATQEIPVIFVSAINETLDIVKAFRLGAVDYVTKPFQIEELLARIESQLTLDRQRKELERLRAKERANFEDLNRMKDQFVNTVSHDLKNPIGVILGSVLLLQDMDDWTTDADAPNLLGAIERNAEFMLDLVTKLLDLARIEAGIGLSLEWLPVNDVLREYADSYRVMAYQKGLSFKVSLPTDAGNLLLDQTQFGRVITNLLSNAIKYTPKGGRVELAAQAEPSKVTISVFDTGLGIPNDDLPHLFEKFHRVARAEHLEEKGTGLGLSIVKAVVEQHHGQITVDSSLGGGSAFRIILPRPVSVVPTSVDLPFAKTGR